MKVFRHFRKFPYFFWEQRGRILNWLPLIFQSWGLLILHYSRLSRSDDKTLVYRMSDHFSFCMRLDSTGVISIFDNYKSIIKEYDWKGKVIIDVGAHVGGFAVPAAVLGARVFAFEPDPMNSKCLAKSRSLNKLEASLTVYPCAVADSSREVTFFLGGYSTVGHMVEEDFFKARRNKQGKNITVKAVGINDLLTTCQVPRCDLLKVDCEGSEYQIIEAATTDTLSRIGAIVLEGHPSQNPKHQFSFIKDKLVAHGFIMTYHHALDNGCYDAYFVHKS